MYSAVKAGVRYQSKLSGFFESDIGVKQGDPCSTILFLFFINDISNNLNTNIDNLFTVDELKLCILLFADDAVIFAHSRQALQSLLNDLHTYCSTWGLTVNTRKTKIMIFEKGRHTSYDFTYNDTVIETVTCFKYLGVTLYKNGNWYWTQKVIAEHSSFALHNPFITFN